MSSVPYHPTVLPIFDGRGRKRGLSRVWRSTHSDLLSALRGIHAASLRAEGRSEGQSQVTKQETPRLAGHEVSTAPNLGYQTGGSLGDHDNGRR